MAGTRRSDPYPPNFRRCCEWRCRPMKIAVRKHWLAAFTLAEICVSVGIGTAVLAAFTYGSVALQRSFAAIEDYTKGMNDQMRISDYLALDMRRAYTISLTGSCAA